MNNVDWERVASRDTYAMSVMNGSKVTVTAALTNHSRFSTPNVVPGNTPESYVRAAYNANKSDGSPM